MEKNDGSKNLDQIDPKDLMAIERSTTALVGLSISLIVFGFVIEKFQLFLQTVSKGLKIRHATAPSLFQHVEFYNFLGIITIVLGISLAIYTYRYYTTWIDHLEQGRIQTDKKIYFLLSIFITFIGLALILSMVIF